MSARSEHHDVGLGRSGTGRSGSRRTVLHHLGGATLHEHAGDATRSDEGAMCSSGRDAYAAADLACGWPDPMAWRPDPASRGDK